MSRIRFIQIKNFRSIKQLDFAPSEGINCFIGPGDSGKSTILDAIDLCLVARRNVQFCDSDFYKLEVDCPIEIFITLGELSDSLKNLDNYGLYLRGFDLKTKELHDEPEADLETVITLKLEVRSDLEPSWQLVSDRAIGQGQAKPLQWSDRAKISPTRIGATASHNLGWQRGSVLNQISDERADTSATLAKAARDARGAFGDRAAEELGSALKIVSETAHKLGIPIGDNVRALLDAHSVSFVGGTISLHDHVGVPLKGLGIGSTRLLIAGLQRVAAHKSSIILVDELEHGLEPHRIIRFLGSLGAKEAQAPLQLFATTHSPIVLRELSGNQLVIVRRLEDSHYIYWVGDSNEAQGTIRVAPDAFLAGSVLVCEGASEVGLIRGLDQYRVSIGYPSIFACGLALVDAGGVNKIYNRAPSFLGLRYRCAVLRDDDASPDVAIEQKFISSGGVVFKWRAGRALEQEIFFSVTDHAIHKLLEKAASDHAPKAINDQIKTHSNNSLDLSTCMCAVTPQIRECLGNAAKKSSWFKTVGQMEEIGREIVGPDVNQGCDADFIQSLTSLFDWSSNVQP
ncbi:Predicted ATP-dependent endonuclease of the OLD family, contains P-loop ATPase and TOPRIM domains [Methylobacterium sp. ap11]|uniref:ATP-dependent nuclease n=1 Tax=Methylobacterium sp. ap11 TaxID=1761799 RepID=UPI0008AC6374|nr:ATP-binding protein [Methylobacterium sp. ap11]SEO43181.1 Predicted ATP-dependent endonuclease of the OLD family, contains P-loop ATPase and TOPRIM domains [Methylobacterium sp. ap11]